MKKLLSATFLMLFATGFPLLPIAQAQTVVEEHESYVGCPFNGHLVCQETGLRIHLNLDEETLDIPGMSFLGPTHGYLDGFTNNDVYGVWMLINHRVEGKKAYLRFTNDIGSDSQDIVLTQTGDSTFTYTASNPNVIRKVDGRKLVKIPSSMNLRLICR